MYSNPYLVKIAEMKDLPYRKRVEVLIIKDGKILVTKNKDKESGKEWFGFPGGGNEGKTDKVTALEESLEEVGIRIKNIQKINLKSFKEEGGLSTKNNRNKEYKGSITTWYSADFDSVDRSKLGDDNDSRRYVYLSPVEALRSVKSSRVISTQRQAAIKALRAL